MSFEKDSSASDVVSEAEWDAFDVFTSAIRGAGIEAELRLATGGRPMVMCNVGTLVGKRGDRYYFGNVFVMAGQKNVTSIKEQARKLAQDYPEASVTPEVKKILL
jgi:hypothetical protein